MKTRWEVWGWYHRGLAAPVGPVATYRLETLARLHAWWFGVANPSGEAWVAKVTSRTM